jgi:hypothetical protein
LRSSWAAGSGDDGEQLRSKSMTAAIIISLSLAPVWRAVPNPHCLYGQKQVEIKQIRQINNIERYGARTKEIMRRKEQNIHEEGDFLVLSPHLQFLMLLFSQQQLDLDWLERGCCCGWLIAHVDSELYLTDRQLLRGYLCPSHLSQLSPSLCSAVLPHTLDCFVFSLYPITHHQ